MQHASIVVVSFAIAVMIGIVVVILCYGFCH